MALILRLGIKEKEIYYFINFKRDNESREGRRQDFEMEEPSEVPDDLNSLSGSEV